jgi:predicted SAM-dependent methyltransferase
MKVISALRKMAPVAFKRWMKAAIFNIKNKTPSESYVNCPICESNLKTFINLGDICNKKFISDLYVGSIKYSASQYETLNIDKFLCPVCGATDKARLYALYFKKRYQLFHHLSSSSIINLVHFAPEGGLGEWLKNLKFINYRSADLYRNDVDDCVDLTDMCTYQDESKDVLICSHILEHISDDDKAIAELYRVLKRGGWGIIMVPIMIGLLHTYEDSSITTEEGRLRHFGLEDHLRVYSKKDFLNKLITIGFEVKEYGSDYFGASVFKDNGISEKSILYIVEKVN